MESHLVDPAILGEFIDALISAKYPDQPAAELSSIKRDAVRVLDHQILKDILGHLTSEQGTELNQLLEDPNTDESAFQAFFDKSQIDVDKIIESTMVSFKDEFMKGGENAEA